MPRFTASWSFRRPAAAVLRARTRPIGGRRSRMRISEYGELVEFWVRTLAALSDKINVVIKINPRYRREEFLYLEKCGVTVAPHDTIDLVPLADIYVTSISSTLAVGSCLRDSEHQLRCLSFPVRGFHRCARHRACRKEVRVCNEVGRLVEDDAHWSDLRRRQAADAPRWAALDGKSTERLVALFDDLSVHRAVSPATANRD